MLPELTSTILRYAKLRAACRAEFEPTGEVITTLRELPYVERWKATRARRWFHIAFEDNSFITFQAEPGPTYVYLDSPIAAPTLPEYLDQAGYTARDRHSPDVQEEYANVIETASLRPHITPLRYDYDERAYRAGIHPAAHLHIGLDNEIRIRLRREMSPTAFLLFVLRQRFPVNWELLLRSSLNARLTNLVRNALPTVSARFHGELDEGEVYLS